MDIQNLVSMANRIGQFFESFSDRNEALEGISNHIHKFWEPRMRRELLAHLDGNGANGLSPIVIDAVRAHRSEWGLVEARSQ
ncbi:formate dehydrogenase subunit delta [Hydrogenophaga sp. PAMC20947]|uniref:formate dehydrogenase subunit delta n=1 Tax=Hydrogenophaga sp. PAMC20947 TaxID=2565558 RepID=UPI00109DECAC|nr:formate dehydrogenase subunit delta [Hydrogenophaga sp. PAMC20947]QCB46051.1 formate dehydrogenase [Hydrogenophaga sp. PAMC20947]